jgi:protein-S-isoprenylcysteine O-methyltransferase Ste14
MGHVAHERGPSGEPRPGTRRLLALAVGLLCHGTFLAAVTAMFVALHGGLLSGRGRLAGSAGTVANAALALQFPLAHSFLLTRRGRGLLGRLWSARFGRDLVPTSYAGIAALQILATFVLWSPSGEVWLRPTGALLWAWTAAYLGAWAFLGKALVDGGLGLQTGWIGWSAVWRGQRVAFPPPATAGLFARCRQPIYLGFALTLWTGPVWTPDRLLLATIWTAYCLVGPIHKERRYLRMHAVAFAEYRARVPYMIPRLRRPA